MTARRATRYSHGLCHRCVPCNDLAWDPSARAITALGMETIAEGVEDREQLEALRAQGCTHVQGYIFSRPVNIDQGGLSAAAPPVICFHRIDRDARIGNLAGRAAFAQCAEKSIAARMSAIARNPKHTELSATP